MDPSGDTVGGLTLSGLPGRRVTVIARAPTDIATRRWICAGDRRTDKRTDRSNASSPLG